MTTAGNASPGAERPAMRFLPVRPGRILVELADLKSTLALLASLEATPVEGIRELVPAARTLLVAFDPGTLAPARLVAEISARDLATAPAAAGALVEIPVRYDGEDLAEVAALIGMTAAELVARHTGAHYRVAFTGFAPGFAYLAGDDPRLDVPRRKTPRTLVPPGSVGLAGEFSGVYPKASPGGWQLIGSTPLAMFDVGRDPAALLRPGDRVRFIDMSGAGAAAAPGPHRIRPAGAKTGREHAAEIEILAAPFPVLVEDLGRPGLASQGVGVSGAADRTSLKAANRAVGNAPGAPALEITLGQLRFRVRGRAVMALAGAPAPVSVAAPDGATLAVAHGEAAALEDGDTVAIGTPARGFRSYLAMRGGFDVEPMLGSASCDTLAGIGPGPLAAGARVGVLRAAAGATVSPGEAPRDELPGAHDVVALDVVLGPRADWFTPEAVARFLSEEWTATGQSSRVGIRLDGHPIERRDHRELPSEATVRGAVQVPASGQPVLFLADHPLTGGYPVIANVAPHHLDLAGQIPVGARIRFNALGEFAEIARVGGRS